MIKFIPVQGKFVVTLFLSITILLSGFLMLPNVASAQPLPCDGDLSPGGNGSDDLLITAPCNVKAGEHMYRNVNIIAPNGVLNFLDEGAETNFWAKSILVENGGTLKAGANTEAGAFGANGGKLTIYLYGSKTDDGIACRSPQQTSGVPCGVDRDIWNSNTKDTINPTSCAKNTMPDGESECFYNYIDPMNPNADFFGSKVLAASYGGTLQMYGKKGATYSELPSNNSGKSWARLNTGGILNKEATSLMLDRDVDWDVNDYIVLTTTDFLPGHSEKLKITEKIKANADGTAKEFKFIVVDPHTNKEIGGLQYPHNGKTYPISTPVRLKQKKITEAETRAAVALLSRSIRVVSAGDSVGQEFGPPTPGSFFGGHVMARQGVKSVEIQGVEFYQLGQGGVKGRYPVHMHLLRKSPKTFIKDNSIHDSMTRWITLHGTQGVTLARNVGFMSIGHGFYLEDGTETDNKLYSNIGILARAAIKNKQNPREVPGILAYTANKIGATTDVPFRSDYIQPTVFWIMNGWNDFEYNMAAGANACGVCYWWLPAQVSGPSQKMKWESYASQQVISAGSTPLKKFKGNYCTSTMSSFNTPNDISPCKGMGGPVEPFLDPVEVGNLSPTPKRGDPTEEYYPKVSGAHLPTFCNNDDCSTSPPPCSAGNLSNCAVTVIEDYTTAFHWTEVNFSAIWLRPQWYLVTNSVISDVLGAGLTFVTGGDYTLSNFLPGQWQLARKNIFIGSTQDEKMSQNYASHAGPVNPKSDILCATEASGAVVADRCVIKNEGLVIPIDPFNYQRLFNIYDGPNFEDSNAFLNVKKTHIDDCNGGGNCSSSMWMYGRTFGMPKDPDSTTTKCILPNAAIAWKQPNGFYYPPAFHSSNLYFKDVDIRHFVVQPLFEPLGPDNPFAFKQNNAAVAQNYCTFINTGPDMLGGTFSNFTAIDRQTILNDDDGSLTGLKDTISVNEDSFFDAPVETVECASLETAKTSPYEHVTTVVYPGCVAKGDCGGTCSRDGKPCADTSNCTPATEGAPNLCENQSWRDDCANGTCYGVPLYRQYLTGDEDGNTVGKQIRMMGMNFFQRSNLTANNGIYYIDTTVSEQDQRDGLLLAPSQIPSLNVFEGGETYYVLQIFAKESTKQTYLYYVGDGFNPDTDVNAISSELRTSRPLDVKSVSWPANWARKWYKDDPTTKIVEVTVDYKEFSTQFANAKKDRCQPKSFCTWQGDVQTGSCECTDKSDKECNEELGDNKNTTCSWAVRAVDCPKGGCLGFSFKLPTGFDAATISVAPPTPECYPSKNPDGSKSVWNVGWDPVRDDDLAGEGCNVNPLPPTNFCDLNEAAGTARNVIRGSEADDELVGTNGPDLIIGGGGNDTIRGRGGNDEIEGGDGDDTIDGGMGDDTIVGGEGNDLIMGGKGHDNIDAGAGDDFVKGGAGNDDVSGGDGNDVLIGQNGNDNIDGNSGDDMIEGKQGADEIDGGSGNDSILGGAGGDDIDGGSGDDMIEGGAGPDTCTQGESGSVCENG